MKKYLVMVDLDGTLIDTLEVNYRAYKEALAEVNVELQRKYFQEFCFGKHYKIFLGKLLLENQKVIISVHNRKKQLYVKYLEYAKVNTKLIELLSCIKSIGHVVLVTTASFNNTMEILEYFKLEKIFDEIITQEDVQKVKPNPECYYLAMKKFNVVPDNCIIFEDSEAGLEAAEKTGSAVFKIAKF